MLSWLEVPRLALSKIAEPEPGVHIRLRLKLPIVVVSVLLVLALLTPDRIWTTLLIGLLGLVVVAYIWALRLAKSLQASRRLRYGWVSVGDRLQEEFLIENSGGVPALWVEVVDHSTVPGYEAGIVQSVGANSQVRWRKAAVCTRRGRFRLGPWSLRSGDPFGLFETTRAYDAIDEIIIHPPIVSQLAVPLPPGLSEGRARSVTRAWQATINASGIREYHSLDPYKWIHWKTSARRDELFVRQFERDAAGDLWLLIDCDAAVQLGTGPEGTEEKAVLLAASLATRALVDARPVGLAVYDLEPQVVKPGLGQAQTWALLRALALMSANGTIPLERALRDLAENTRHGSAALIITASSSADWIPSLLTLEQHGIEVHVLLLDRGSFGGAGEAGHSEGLQRAIIASGFRCQTLTRDSIGTPVLDGERHGFWEFKVTGTGKAIAVRRPVD